jgi:uncharacterized damage-inducible protein DinB
MRIEDIREMYAYNHWANSRVLAAAGGLSAEELERDLRTSFGSIRGTFTHVLAVDWVWLERGHGRSPSSVPGVEDWRTVADFQVRWAEVDRGWTDLLEGLTDESLGAEVAYTNFAGVPHRYPLGKVLYHVVNHGSYHRGQVTAMLRELGHQGVSTDFIYFLDDV